MAIPIVLCRFNDICDSNSRGFDPCRTGHDTMFVVRQSGQMHAYYDACPHYGGTPMAWRKDAYLNQAGDRIICSAHGAQFEIETGQCTLGPCLGQSLEKIDVAITQEGELVVLLNCPIGDEN